MLALSAVRERAYVYWQRLVASDPGLGRLMNSIQVASAVGVTIAVEYGSMQATHAMWRPAATASAAAAQHHGITLLAMLIGGMVAMISTLAVNDPQPRQQIVTLSFVPVPMLATLALSIELSPHHTLGLIVLVLVMGLGTYTRKFAERFGPRAFVYGVLLFMGYFFGFLAASEVSLRNLGWIAAILWLAVAVNIALRLLIFIPVRRGDVVRMERAFVARARRVAGAGFRMVEATDRRERQRALTRMRRRLVRLDESALMIDGQLVSAQPGVPAWRLHRKVFEIELAVQNLGRMCAPLPETMPDPLRARLAAMLAALGLGADSRAVTIADELIQGGEPTGADRATAIRARALAGAVSAAVQALRLDLASDYDPQLDDPFESPVKLMGGNLPGSSRVSAEVAAASGPADRSGRLRLSLPAETAIRMMVAVGAATAAGSALSERRFYWAVIAVFIAFMGANTAGEQIIKAANRVLGTVIGILLGSLLARAIGPSSWSIAVILASLAIGVYFQRISYSLMVAGVTIMVAQLYVQLGEYSISVLGLRLAETALGAVIAMLSALLIFPVGTRRATGLAVAGALSALRDLLSRIVEDAADRRGRHFSTAQRALDDAVQQLIATARPLVHDPFMPRKDLERGIALIDSIAHFSRNLIASTRAAERDHPGFTAQLQPAVEALQGSLAALDGALRDRQEQQAYPPSTSALTALEHELAEQGAPPFDPRRMSVRALVRIEQSLGDLADALRLPTPAAEDDGETAPAGAR